jgi:hypothetical protein
MARLAEAGGHLRRQAHVDVEEAQRPRRAVDAEVLVVGVEEHRAVAAADDVGPLDRTRLQARVAQGDRAAAPGQHGAVQEPQLAEVHGAEHAAGGLRQQPALGAQVVAHVAVPVQPSGRAQGDAEVTHQAGVEAQGNPRRGELPPLEVLCLGGNRGQGQHQHQLAHRAS